MRTPELPSEDHRECRSFPRSQGAATRHAAERLDHWKPLHPSKPNLLARLVWAEGQTIASFGGTDLVRHHDGRWELRGGLPEEHAAAREWCSQFQPEASFSSAPMPVVLAQPQAQRSKSLRNHVLIADDDALVRGSLAAVLEYEGFVVDEAENGLHAVAHALKHFPDIILLDLNMPQMDGWTAFTKLDQVRPLVPVIVITARPNQYREAVRLGVDAFMEKPLEIGVLVQAIRLLTGEAGKNQENRTTDRAFVTRLLGSHAC